MTARRFGKPTTEGDNPPTREEIRAPIKNTPGKPAAPRAGVPPAPFVAAPSGSPYRSVKHSKAIPREAPPAPRTRYVFDTCLARGGMGEVWLAKDMRLNREVAIKLVRAERAKESRVVNAVIQEARLTARLEHPNIVPVHDLGVTEDGRFFYTMKRVHGQSLSHILRAKAKGNARVSEEYSLPKLLSIARQVCLAVAYVHSEGVLHRDLKPSNVMIGDYGEVILIDWGLARLKIKREGTDAHLRRRTDLVQGTPAYMAPEQAKYGLPGTDERSDVYSLGAMLYQSLVLRPPYRRRKSETLDAYLRRILTSSPPPPHEFGPESRIPRDLSALTMRCMSPDPDERIQDARTLARELELHIEGKKAEARRSANANARIRLAREAVTSHDDLRHKLQDVHQMLQLAIDETPAWAVDTARDSLYALEAEAMRIERDVHDAYAAAERRFHEALTYVPDQNEARAGLADLYWERFRVAEAAGAEADCVHYETLIRHLDEDRYASRLMGEGRLEVRTEPKGCEVQICACVERNRRVHVDQPRTLGTSPTSPIPMAMGSYLILVLAPDGQTLRCPIFMGREESLVLRVPVFGDLPLGITLVPGGSFPYGPAPSTRMDLPHFGIGRQPVTFGQYLQFVDDLDTQDRFEAWQRLPRSERIPGHRWQLHDGHYVLDDPDVAIELDHPVVGVSHDDARSYCRWLSEREGRRYHLPSEMEWEKAARGPDGRLYPWGNVFDPSFCLMRDTREGGAAIEPVGTVPGDESPYGLRDMAGLVREWCDGWFSEEVGQRPNRGGSWSDPAESCGVTVRRGSHESHTADNLGFRVVLEIDG